MINVELKVQVCDPKTSSGQAQQKHHSSTVAGYKITLQQALVTSFNIENSK